MAVHAAIIALLLDKDEDQEDQDQSSKTRVRPWIKNRQNAGAFHTLFLELKLHEKTRFFLLSFKNVASKNSCILCPTV